MSLVFTSKTWGAGGGGEENQVGEEIYIHIVVPIIPNCLVMFDFLSS